MGKSIKYEQLLKLYTRLCNGEVINAREEALDCEISKRSIQRYIASLNGFLADCERDGQKHQEIIYDRKKKGYRLVHSDERYLSIEELYALIKILLGSKGLVKEEMQTLIGKLIGLCNEEVQSKELKASTSNETLKYAGPNHGKPLLEKTWLIAQAVEHCSLIEVGYKRLEGQQEVKRILEPVGVMFSEYYFYLLAYIKGIREEKGKKLNPTIYRIDRIQGVKVLDEHFQIPYSEKFEEQKFRDSMPLMFGGDIHRLKFWYSGPSLEAVLDRIPTARVVKEEQGRWLLSAEVIGNGAEMWLRGQGKNVEFPKALQLCEGPGKLGPKSGTCIK